MAGLTVGSTYQGETNAGGYPVTFADGRKALVFSGSRSGGNIDGTEISGMTLRYENGAEAHISNNTDATAGKPRFEIDAKGRFPSAEWIARDAAAIAASPEYQAIARTNAAASSVKSLTESMNQFAQGLRQEFFPAGRPAPQARPN